MNRLLRKKPLGILLSLYTNWKNALTCLEAETEQPPSGRKRTPLFWRGSFFLSKTQKRPPKDHFSLGYVYKRCV